VNVQPRTPLIQHLHTHLRLNTHRRRRHGLFIEQSALRVQRRNLRFACPSRAKLFRGFRDAKQRPASIRRLGRQFTTAPIFILCRCGHAACKLFTNHIGLAGGEFTDAIWVYWAQNLNKWDAKNKAIVLDGSNCTWSAKCIGLPGVIKVGNRRAILYDAPGGNSTSHMQRDIGLAWLELPLAPPR
jgi:hypothetical protein